MQNSNILRCGGRWSRDNYPVIRNWPVPSVMAVFNCHLASGRQLNLHSLSRHFCSCHQHLPPSFIIILFVDTQSAAIPPAIPHGPLHNL